jgi:hypothetical protein
MPRAGAEPFSTGETIRKRKKPRTSFDGLGSVLGVKYRHGFFVVVFAKLDAPEEVFSIDQVGDFVELDPDFLCYPIRSWKIAERLFLRHESPPLLCPSRQYHSHVDTQAY